jgi:hypothetical protein
MPRPIQEVISEKRTNIIQHFRCAGWVQSVAAMIDAHSSQVKAARVTADALVSLQHRNLSVAAASQPKRGAEARRSCAQNNDM